MSKCKICALQKNHKGLCPIFGKPMDHESGCPYFATEFEYCEKCGNPISDTNVIVFQEEDEATHVICPNCNKDLCGLCSAESNCAYFDDISCGEPPYITIQQRHNGAIYQVQTLNPKRIAALCTKCPCYLNQDDGQYCMKRLDNRGCDNFKSIWKK